MIKLEHFDAFFRIILPISRLKIEFYDQKEIQDHSSIFEIGDFSRSKMVENDQNWSRAVNRG